MPKNQTNVTLKYLTPLEAEEKHFFGPVFERKFLIEALKLQLNIENLRAKTSSGESITLNQTCFKPLEPDNKNCAIMSLFQYHQNDLEFLNETFYPSQYLECIQSPITQKTKSLKRSCMAEFGGPIDPYMVLGGFPIRDGRDSILSFVFFFETISSC